MAEIGARVKFGASVVEDDLLVGFRLSCGRQVVHKVRLAVEDSPAEQEVPARC